MNWELVLKVATLIISTLALVDKGYELIKKRRARKRVYKTVLKSPNFLSFLKKKAFSPKLFKSDLVLLSNFMPPTLFKKKIMVYTKFCILLAD